MDFLEFYSPAQLKKIVRTREHETKIGDSIYTINSKNDWQNELALLPAKYVLLGIPEDIGVRANFGRGGAHTAWKPALESFLNQQSNNFLNGNECCVLGQITVDDLIEKADALNLKQVTGVYAIRLLVAELDDRVSNIISKIIQANKIPIVIGGGHNNSFPIIKGCSIALQKKINVINCDPHTDFRAIEGRHSGNGFSYAYHQHYLENYAVCYIHEQYNTQEVLNQFAQLNQFLYYNTYEDVFIREKITFNAALNECIGFTKHNSCGIELDLDAITNVPTSAKTSSGISPIQARQYVYQTAKQLNALYLHIAEGAPILSHLKADNKTGKLIAYLISDFIKGKNEGNTLEAF